MTMITGQVNKQGYADESLDAGFYTISPIIPPINQYQTMPVTWPPKDFFQSDPLQNGNFDPFLPAIAETPLKDDVQLDQERRELANAGGSGPNSLLWLLLLAAGAYYAHKKGVF